MTHCILVSDLHGKTDRYQKLMRLIAAEAPHAVFIGGDLLPSALESLTAGNQAFEDFVRDYMLPEFTGLRRKMGTAYPRVFIIMGNDDPRALEASLIEAASSGIWEYVHMRRVLFGDFKVYGYAYVPPTPFILKDWEKYDVSRYVDPGCISPEEGRHSVPISASELKYGTIRDDLDRLAGDDDLADAIFLFHAPPYETGLDRAALDGNAIDHIPLDVHIGSIAVRRFIEERLPLLTLHGHVHESHRLTDSWRDRIGTTVAFSAAHEGPELAVVSFSPGDLETATRRLI
jgi:Icc-related predicted phosphoesterase